MYICLNFLTELVRLQEEILKKNNSIKELREKEKLEIGAGPCASSLDKILQELGIERQAYHGKSFIGNHCHKLLKVRKLHIVYINYISCNFCMHTYFVSLFQEGNIKYLCDRIPTIVEKECDNPILKMEETIECQKFECLFRLYSSCHIIFNSSAIMTQETLNRLGELSNLIIINIYL